MRHRLALFFMLSLCAVGIVTVSSHIAIAERQPPAYAKWGRLAVLKTQEKYPNANVVDYLHVGRKQRANTTSETFKLWLKTTDREFGVFVTITFNTATEQLISITFQETPR